MAWFAIDDAAYFLADAALQHIPAYHAATIILAGDLGSGNITIVPCAPTGCSQRKQASLASEQARQERRTRSRRYHRAPRGR
jgi:hypothetical protein